jgi:uncharacterized RDD family membrane protein YckC
MADAVGRAATPPPATAGAPGRKRRRPPAVPASFTQRLGAFLIDQLACTTAAGILGFGSGAGAALLGADPAGVGLLTLAAGGVVPIAYFWLLTAWRGATIGKEMIGIVVVRADGRPISRNQALGRVLAAGLSTLPLGIGFLLPLLREDRRALHDLACGTKVVRANLKFRDVSTAPLPPPGEP